MEKKENKKENKSFGTPICNITSDYCNIFENMGEGISIFEIVYDEDKVSDLRVIYINPASILNKLESREKIIGKTIIGLCGVDNVTSYLKMAEEVISTGKSIRYEITQFNKYLLINAFSPHKNLFVTLDVDITREKEAEKALKESEAKYRTIFENTGIAFMIIDEDMTISLINEEVEKTFGYLKKDIENKRKWTEFVAKKDELVRMKGYHQLRRESPENAPKEYEFHAIDINGDIRNILVTVSIIPGTRMSIASFLDITERKKAEKALKESEAKYRTIFESTGIAFAVMEEDTTISLMNTESEKIMGYSKEEIEGKRKWTEFVTEKDDLEKMKNYHILRRVDPNAAPKRYEFQATSKDGDIKDIIITISMIPGTKKSIASFLDNTERKKVENALKESEAKYRTIFENTGIAFMIIDEDMTISLINEEVEKTFGYLKEEVEGKRKWTEFVATKNDRERMKEYHRIRRENPEAAPKQYDYHAIAKNGEIKDVIVTVSMISGSKMTIASFIDITDRKKDEKALKESEEKLREARDNLEIKVHKRTKELEESNKQLKQEIKERKKVEKALKASEKRYRALYEDNPSMYFTIDSEGIILSVNSFGAEELGYSASELIGQSMISVVFYREDRKLAAQNLKQCIENYGQVFQWEQRKIRKDGSVLWVRETARAAKRPDGKIVVFIVCEDITDRKEAEEALRESEERFKILFEYAPDPYFLTDMEGNFLDGNKAAERLIGFKRESIIGKNIVGLGLISEDQVPKAFKLLSINIQGASTGPEEFVLTKKDGKKVSVEITGYPIEIRGYKLVLGMARDISERKEAEEKLKETIGELKRSNEELQQFAYITSHDLQEPLRTIASFTQLIEKRYKGQLDTDADEFIDFIVDAAMRMKEMIQGLLDYSRVGTRGAEFNVVDIEEVLKVVLSNLRAAITENNAEITHDRLPTIIADKNQLIQLFQNLVSNAIKFKKPDTPPKIHISARKDEENKEYVFSISDNGIGLELQYRDKIFEVFKRLHTMDEYKGAGIGLAISKRIIERHGGRIWVKSEPRAGSTFYFILPNL